MSTLTEFEPQTTARGKSARAVVNAFALPWLVFLGFFFIKFIYITPPAWEIALSTAVLLVFLVAYFHALRNYHRASKLRLPSMIILGLGVLMAPINPGANVFFSYPSWFIGRAFPPRQAVVVLVLVVVTIIAITYFFNLSLNFFIPALLLTIGLGFMSLATRRFEDAQHALLQSRAESEHLGRIAERERIARDLHDAVGHSLSVIALKSDLAAQLATDAAPDAAREARAINDVARQVLAEIRATLSGYWELSLDAELKALTASLEEANIETTTKVTAADLPPVTETALAMCLREAVTNVLRHSESTRCELSIEINGDEIVARVADNGVGIKGAPGRGLSGMRQRVEQMAGSLNIFNADGTTVEVRLPRMVSSGA